MAPEILDVAVVGGGAAGFFAAVTCADRLGRGRVTLLEKSREVLGKVRVSGGGRCNVTHACFEPQLLISHYPRGGQALLGPFHKFQPRHTIEWFESRGVTLKTEADGRVFPVTDKSQTIIDALTVAAGNAGVDVRVGVFIEKIQRAAPGFSIFLKNGASISCRRLLLATGSNPLGWQWASALGHHVEPPVPSLFTFTIQDDRLRDLAGISVPRARVGVQGSDLRQTGPLLITHTGLSGPAILKLSAWGARLLHDRGYQAALEINWLDSDGPAVEQQLRDRKISHPRQSLGAHPLFGLPARLWERLVESSRLPKDLRWADMSNPQMRRLAEELSAGVYTIRGKNTFKEEFVTCGGVALDEVDFRTMESRRCPGLYFAGEILDIDGVTGGFNFQNAWTTAWLAGNAMGHGL